MRFLAEDDGRGEDDNGGCDEKDKEEDDGDEEIAEEEESVRSGWAMEEQEEGGYDERVEEKIAWEEKFSRKLELNEGQRLVAGRTAWGQEDWRDDEEDEDEEDDCWVIKNRGLESRITLRLELCWGKDDEEGTDDAEMGRRGRGASRLLGERPE